MLRWLYVIVLAGALLTGIGIRFARLGEVPPGFHQDEACNGYDAYSILKTGRGQHGHFMPILAQAFNDYRPVLIDYTAVPLIAAFGLKPAVVRMAGALWGSVDLIAITILAGLMFGLPGAAMAALLCAFSPWQLPLSRLGAAYITASTLVSLATLCFFRWLEEPDRRRWLFYSSIFFGLAFYSHPITKAFVPPFLMLLAVLHWKECKQAGFDAILALVLVGLIAIPQAAVIALTPAARTQFGTTSLFKLVSEYSPHASLFAHGEVMAAAWASYFTPRFLFLQSYFGDPDLLLNLPEVGNLLPIQAVLIVPAVCALFIARRRKIALLLIGWLMIAAIPGGMTVPPGLRRELPAPPKAGRVTAFEAPSATIRPAGRPSSPTPGLLLAHPAQRRDLLAIAPWTLFSALGFVVLIDLVTVSAPATAVVVVGLILITGVQGVERTRAYFRDYPVLAAPFFKYGMEQVVRGVDQLGDPNQRVAVSSRIAQAYIFFLFFDQYPPALFQKEPDNHRVGLFTQVREFGRYYLYSPYALYFTFPHGTFVFAGAEPLPAKPALVIRYPDGTLAYSIVVK